MQYRDPRRGGGGDGGSGSDGGGGSGGSGGSGGGNFGGGDSFDDDPPDGPTCGITASDSIIRCYPTEKLCWNYCVPSDSVCCNMERDTKSFVVYCSKDERCVNSETIALYSCCPKGDLAYDGTGNSSTR